jgi:hypothetical protein
MASERERTPAEVEQKRRNTRSLAIAGGLVLLAVLFYLITIFRMGGAVLTRQL